MAAPMAMALTAAQAVSGVIGQQQAAKANAKYQQDLAIARNDQITENNRLAGVSYRQGVAATSRQTSERDRAMAADLRMNALRSLEAQSTARVAAGESGIGGNSIEALLQDFQRTEGTYAAMVEANRKGLRMADMDQKSALKAQAEGRMASIQPYVASPIAQPDYLGAALRIGSGVWSAGEKYLGWGMTPKQSGGR